MNGVPPWVGDVPCETMDRLARYAALLVKWNAAINLVGRTTEPELWQRHIWDSYQLVPLVPHGTKTIADMGSGAGLPGIVLACALPDVAVTLIERDVRKASFLREAVRHLGLTNAFVKQGDVADHQKNYDLVTSRALASLDLLFAYSAPLMGKGAICLFPKGENFAKEVQEAAQRWVFTHHVIHSKTNDKAGIISVAELKLAGMGSKQ